MLPCLLSARPPVGHAVCAAFDELKVAISHAFKGGVFFLRVPPPPEGATAAIDATVQQLQRQLLHMLGLSDDKSPLQQQLNAAFCTQQRQLLPHLLVLDDVWDQRLLEQLSFRTMRGAVLMTTRTSMCSHASLSDVWLRPDEASREASRQLLSTVAKPLNGSDKQQVGGWFLVRALDMPALP